MKLAEAQGEIDAWTAELRAELTVRGLRPQAVRYEPGEDVVAVVFVLIATDPVWRKAVTLHADVATPDAFQRALTVWKTSTITDMTIGTPALVVQQAIKAHGRENVLEALRG